MSNKWFICGLAAALLIVFSSVLLSVAWAAELFAPKHVTLTWTADPQTTQTITWKTAAGESDGQIEYAEADGAGEFPEIIVKIAAQSELLSTEAGDMMIHTVTLNRLKPGVRYVYRLGSGDNWSRLYSFTTAAAGISAFKFLVFGDSQSVQYDTWRTVIEQAYTTNADAAFLTVVGDLVDVGQDYSQWEGWFDAAAGVIDTIAVMPLTGNHENYTPVWGERSLPKLFAAQFKLPDNGPEGLKGLVYSFDYGNAHFTVLDSQEREEARFIPNMLEKQQAWLDADLAATAKMWKIVFFHKPPYHSVSGRGNDTVREAFVPILDKHHVDVVFNGHDHIYARTYPLFSDKIVDSSVKGTIYVTTGRSGTKAHQDALPNDMHDFFYNPNDEPNYLTVEILSDCLTVKAFKHSGVLIDCWRIDKSGLLPMYKADSRRYYDEMWKRSSTPLVEPIAAHRSWSRRQDCALEKSLVSAA